ncbi:MAG: hypothetical protein FWB77_02475 [Treponema sp.]|nr:hypothetical protein [Treponema sp.]
MKKINNWLVISVMILVFGNVIMACSNQVDKSLNGSWSSDSFVLSLNNGKFEESINEISWRKGTYTTSKSDIYGEITVTPTHVFGGGFNVLFGISENESGIESKWFSINDFIDVFRSAMIKMGLSESQAEKEVNDFVNAMNSQNRTSTYNISGDTLFLTNNGLTQSLTKK